MGNNLFLIPKTDSVPSRRHWKSIPLSARVFLFILLCSVGMLRAADNYAQNTLLRIHASEQRVSDVLAQIEASPNSTSSSMTTMWTWTVLFL